MNKQIFCFISNNPKSDIRLSCQLLQISNEYYSLYYKFEKDKSVKKEIYRMDVYWYDLPSYIETDMEELRINFGKEYRKLYDICLDINHEE